MKDKMKQIIYCLMVVIGLLIVGGIIYLDFDIINGIGVKEILPILNAKLLNSTKLKEENNNKYVALWGTITSTATDPVFNVTVNGVGIKRVVFEWNGNSWMQVGDNSGELYETEIFNTKYLEIGGDCIVNNYNFNNLMPVFNYKSNNLQSPLESNDFGLDLDIENVKLPSGFSIKKIQDESSNIFDEDYFLSVYSASAYSNYYITNSASEQPKVGDIKIYFQALFPKGSRYVSLFGKQVDKKIELDSQSIIELSSDYMAVQLWSYYFYATFIIYKIIGIILCVFPFLGFMLLFFGIARLNIIEKKFGKIQGYKIFLLSLAFGIIISLVFYLIM
ncbi:MAG: hypothetical protein IJ068_06945 [Bacilli bacterium]|nr:hypothetical protein [Bacilli bacterium]